MKPDVKITFPKDVKNHALTVLMDNGIYRHLKFMKPEHSFDQWFEIITWPGTLVINGDMGSWAFSRVDDMFTFFRRDNLSINEGYWSEKIQSVSKFEGSARKFSMEVFRQDVLDRLEGYDLPRKKKREVIAALGEDVFGAECEHEARGALYHFDYNGFCFLDTGDIDGCEWNRHFLWNLYAIVWGIQQYDALKQPVKEAA